MVIFKKYWFFSYKSIHISELCITELLNRLSKFKQGDSNYTSVYNWHFEHIILYKTKNVIDWLYLEFLKIKKTCTASILYENDTLLRLPESNKNKYETIGNIIYQKEAIETKPIYHIKSKKLKIIQNMYESLLKDSFINKVEKTKFLLIQQ
jgi:hypothetical protein